MAPQPFFSFHHANAFETADGKVVLDTVANLDGVDFSANFEVRFAGGSRRLWLVLVLDTLFGPVCVGQSDTCLPTFLPRLEAAWLCVPPSHVPCADRPVLL